MNSKDYFTHTGGFPKRNPDGTIIKPSTTIDAEATLTTLSTSDTQSTTEALECALECQESACAKCQVQTPSDEQNSVDDATIPKKKRGTSKSKTDIA